MLATVRAMLLAALGLQHPPPVSRRLALSTLAVLPLSAAAAEPADDVALLRRGLYALDDLLSHWTEATVDCRYGEIKRELLAAENKAELIAKANSTSKASTTVTVCKSSGAQIRRTLGTTAESSLSRIGSVLERPRLLARVRDDDQEAFQAASERLQTAIAAADADAFSAAKDYSAQTTFKRGETPDTPNLDAARESVVDARDSLRAVVRLLE